MLLADEHGVRFMKTGNFYRQFWENFKSHASSSFSQKFKLLLDLRQLALLSTLTHCFSKLLLNCTQVHIWYPRIWLTRKSLVTFHKTITLIYHAGSLSFFCCCVCLFSICADRSLPSAHGTEYQGDERFAEVSCTLIQGIYT